MSAFSVGSFSADDADWLRGFSFIPDVPGPNGSGSPGSAASVSVTSIIVGCPTEAAAEQANTCYLYSEQLDSPSEIGLPENCIGRSDSATVGNDFGSGSYSTSYAFSNISLDPKKQYFAYFNADKNTAVDSSSPYQGGTAFDVFMEDDLTSPQFQVNMSA